MMRWYILVLEIIGQLQIASAVSAVGNNIYIFYYFTTVTSLRVSLHAICLETKQSHILKPFKSSKDNYETISELELSVREEDAEDNGRWREMIYCGT